MRIWLSKLVRRTPMKTMNELEKVQTLIELVQHYSPSGQEENAVNYLVQRMKDLGFDKAYKDEIGNAVEHCARIGNGCDLGSIHEEADRPARPRSDDMRPLVHRERLRSRHRMNGT